MPDTKELIEKFETHHKTVVKLMEDATAGAKAVDARLSDIEQKMIRRAPGGGGEAAPSWGKSIVESPELKSFIEGGARGRARIELKTVVTIGSGATLAGPMIAPQIITDPTILPRRRMTVRDLLAPGSTNSNAVWFPRQTARQNNAVTVAETALKPQSDVTMELVQTNVQTIAHFMIAARQALDDAPALQSLIDGELRYGLSLVEEAQLLVGDGSETNLLGLIPQATAYSAAFVVTGETAIDRLALALLQSEQALLPATGIVVNFTDWENADDQGRHGQVYFGGSRRGHPAATLGRSACRHAGNIRRQLPGRLILYRGADIRSDGS